MKIYECRMLFSLEEIRRIYLEKIFPSLAAQLEGAGLRGLAQPGLEAEGGDLVFSAVQPVALFKIPISLRVAIRAGSDGKTLVAEIRKVSAGPIASHKIVELLMPKIAEKTKGVEWLSLSGDQARVDVSILAASHGVELARRVSSVAIDDSGVELTIA